ncbi:FxsA family protein [Thalassotalea sp. HSM 43]|uniref:FxsA family protein n=1 Tax=Thalassotalea sp. HSM 43 TaxID=2552945 RepID=UPI0010800315|nr:FxsA family protein [Thalassotalea sp. HSM 43]QBY03903.1 FxsA family protein [Thalassotalea sp. HSM 43]
MFRVLFLLFIIMPIIEIMVLMNVGALIGALPTIVLVIVTAWLGAKMVRQQGLATYQSVQHKLAQGQMPSDEIIAALLLLVAGVLLLTPGFITDGFGLALLWPVSRGAIVKLVQQQLAKSQKNGSAFFYTNVNQQQDFQDFYQQQGSQANPFQQNDDVIDIEADSKTIDADKNNKRIE